MRIPRRRWLRFSLRTLLVGMLAVGIWLGLWVRSARRQQDVVAWVRQQDGEVYYEDDTGSGTDYPHWKYLPFPPSWKGQLGRDLEFNVVGISIEYASEQALDIAPLGGLPHLERLSIIGTPVKNLEPLRHLADLEVLDIDTDDANLDPLRGKTNLRALDLYSKQSRDLGPLADLTGLSRLVLNVPAVESLEPLAGLKNLARLAVYAPNIESLEPLAGLRRLEHVVLRGETRVRQGQIDQLRASLPNCTVSCPWLRRSRDSD